MIKVALVGNPNCGKTTLFNSLTGSTARVGNWPGVTVDKKEGVYKKLGENIGIIDLPGIYSLSPYTPEEVVSRNFIIEEKPDCIINIVDATNLERNLYLTTQLLEINVPIVIALNMMDLVRKRGDTIDVKSLEKALGVPVVEISALKSEGNEELMLAALNAKERHGVTVLENTVLKPLIDSIDNQMKLDNIDNSLFHAIKLIEMDELEIKGHKLAVGQVQLFKETNNIDTEAVIADERYKYIEKNYSPCYKKSKEDYVSKSDKIDRVVTHKVFGYIIFAVVLFLVFHLTFSENFLFLGGLLKIEGPSFEGHVFEGLFYTEAGINSPGVIFTNFFVCIIEWLFGLIGGLFEGTAPWLNSLVNDGILAGLSAILGFIPIIITLYFFLSLLEDSGYMARVAFIFDRIFKKFGLSGRALMPMIMGFGCSVPAMSNTRTLQNQNERTSVVRVIPFFSCGAKLPILTAISGAIVSYYNVGNTDLITYSMYLVGIAIAIIAVILMRGTTMRGDQQPFIMELPAYHKPSMRSLFFLVADKAKHFVKKAFTIILASTIVIWFLTNFTFSWKLIDGEVLTIENSIIASFGQLLQPIFTPLGFGSQLGKWGWVFIVAAITGLIAKENVIATFGTLAACIAAQMSISGIDIESEAGAVEAMIAATGITIPGLIAFIIFNLTTIPCFAAVAAAKGESPSKKTFKFTILFWIVTSFISATVCYVVGSWWWMVFVVAAIIALVIFFIHLYNKKHPIVMGDGDEVNEALGSTRNSCCS